MSSTADSPTILALTIQLLWRRTDTSFRFAEVSGPTNTTPVELTTGAQNSGNRKERGEKMKKLLASLTLIVLICAVVAMTGYATGSATGDAIGHARQHQINGSGIQ